MFGGKVTYDNWAAFEFQQRPQKSLKGQSLSNIKASKEERPATLRKVLPHCFMSRTRGPKKKILADSRACHRIQTARSGGGLVPSAKCFSPKYIQWND